MPTPWTPPVEPRLAHPPALPRTWIATLMGLLLATLLGGCASDAALEARFGDSQRQAIAAQSVRGTEAPPPARPAPLDGVAAAHAVERYQQSFQRPPAPLQVLNLLTGPGNAGMPAASAAPR